MSPMLFKFQGYNCIKGQSLAEYSLVLGLISIALIGSLSLLGQNLNDSAKTVNSSLMAFGNSLSGNPTSAGVGGNQPPPPNSNNNGQNGTTTGGNNNTGSNPNNQLGTQNVCIKANMCFNIPNPAQAGQKVSDVSGDMGQEMIKQYAQTMDQVLAQLKKDDPTLLAQFPELGELANRGHKMGETLNDVFTFCKENNISNCTSQNIEQTLQSLNGANNNSSFGSFLGGSSSNNNGTITGPKDTLASRRDFQEQVLKVRDLFNGALKDRVSEPSKNLVKLMSLQINNIHNGAIGTYSQQMAQGQGGGPDPNIWNWPSVPSLSSGEIFTTYDNNGAELIKIDSNVICGVGNTGNCTK